MSGGTHHPNRLHNAQNRSHLQPLFVRIRRGLWGTSHAPPPLTMYQAEKGTALFCLKFFSSSGVRDVQFTLLLPSGSSCSFDLLHPMSWGNPSLSTHFEGQSTQQWHSLHISFEAVIFSLLAELSGHSISGPNCTIFTRCSSRVWTTAQTISFALVINIIGCATYNGARFIPCVFSRFSGCWSYLAMGARAGRPALQASCAKLGCPGPGDRGARVWSRVHEACRPTLESFVWGMGFSFAKT